jgi:hypothetical protein
MDLFKKLKSIAKSRIKKKKKKEPHSANKIQKKKTHQVLLFPVCQQDVSLAVFVLLVGYLSTLIYKNRKHKNHIR